jgi:hypothetical protein
MQRVDSSIVQNEWRDMRRARSDFIFLVIEASALMPASNQMRRLTKTKVTTG